MKTNNMGGRAMLYSLNNMNMMGAMMSTMMMNMQAMSMGVMAMRPMSAIDNMAMSTSMGGS